MNFRHESDAALSAEWTMRKQKIDQDRKNRDQERAISNELLKGELRELDNPQLLTRMANLVKEYSNASVNNAMAQETGRSEDFARGDDLEREHTDRMNILLAELSSRLSVGTEHPTPEIPFEPSGELDDDEE